jgi:chromosome segregation ATPase
MTRDKDPLEPRAALRRAGGGNEPDITEVPADLLADLEEARNRVAKAEAEVERQRVEIEAAGAREQALKDALKAARAAVISEREFGDMSRTLLADFEAHAKSKEADLQAELAAAKAAEAARHEEVQEAARSVQEAQERATEALQRAEKAETTVRQAKAMPGIKGWLVRWLAGAVLPD